MASAHPEIPGLSEWQPLARGGFATVWEARQSSLDRLVAVKVDQRALDTDKDQRRFLREAGAAGRLSGHPGIVTVHDAGILPDGRPYLVMDLCPGGSLTQWLKPDHRQSEARIRDVGVRIADALAAAHARGVLHRDVKPANILIDSYDNPGLADFGLAALPAPGVELSVTMEALTPAYAPREVFYQQPPSEQGDVYSLAATMYALLDGKPARWPEVGTPILPEILDLLQRPIERLPHVNEQLMDVLLAAMADEPTDRPTAAQFRDQLRAIDLAAPPPVPAAVPSTVEPTSEITEGSRSRRRSGLALALAFVVVTLVAVGTVIGVRSMRLAGSPTGQPSVVTTPSVVPSSSAGEPTSASPAPPTVEESPATTEPAVPEGFADCSATFGPRTFCPTTPECWGGVTQLSDIPALAEPEDCDELHPQQTFAAGQLPFPIRVQSQLDDDPRVRRLCSEETLNRMLRGEDMERDWQVQAVPPQIYLDDDLYRCLVSTGEDRNKPLRLSPR